MSIYINYPLFRSIYIGQVIVNYVSFFKFLETIIDKTI